jgi:AhpC/TSA family
VDLGDGESEIDVKRKWNWSLWVGFVCAIAGFLSYFFFIQFPFTRDFPWVNFLLFGVGGIFLLAGLVRAFGKPQLYRGKVFGPILAVLSVLISGFFFYLIFYELRQVPASTGAPHVGQKAPEFTLPDQDDKPAALADLISGSKAVVLIFYRGFW